jgi:hypothetical protein
VWDKLPNGKHVVLRGQKVADTSTTGVTEIDEEPINSGEVTVQ